MTRYAAVFVSALCGALLAMPFRSWETSAPAWFALAPVIYLVAAAEKKRWAALRAAAFALTWSVLSFTFFWHLAPAGVVALALQTSSFYVAVLFGARCLARRGVLAAVLGTASLWTLAELARATLPVVCFPWLQLGHTLLYCESLRQCADLLGVYGLSFLIAAVNAWLAFGLPELLPRAALRRRGDDSFQAASALGRRSQARLAAGILVVLLIAAFGYGRARIAQLEPRLTSGPPIGVIQGNIVQKLDRTAEELTAQIHGHLELHRQVVAAGQAAPDGPLVLVCWAETMVPGCLHTDLWGREFKRGVAAGGVPTLAGSNVETPAAAPDEEPRTFNAAFLLDRRANEVCRYFKRRLVPCGEYVPGAREYRLMRLLRSVTRDQYLPGSAPSPVCDVPAKARATAGLPDSSGVMPYRIALNICIEDIHAGLAREAVQHGADTLVNLTNDGWFYGSYGPRSHLQAAAWRAIEMRRPLLRVTNTGWTVAVDPLGRVEVIVPPETVGFGIVRLKRVALDGTSWPCTLTLFVGEWGAAAFFAGILAASTLLGHRRMQLVTA